MLFSLILLIAIVTLIIAKPKFRWYLLIFYILGGIVSILSSIEVFYFFDQKHEGDQDFFIKGAIDFYENDINLDDLGLNYFFYKLFLYLSSPWNDYLIVGIFGKLCFTLIWGISMTFFFNKEEFDRKEQLIISLLFLIGWFYSTYVLRDGFVALGFLIFFGALAKQDKSYSLAFLGLVILAITRIQIPLLFLPTLIIYFIVKIIPFRISPSYLILGLFLLGLITFKFAPLPQQLVTPLALTLLPHGETAEAASPIPKPKLALIYYEGGQEAKDIITQLWITRFPSIFYEPNPFRYIFWPFLGEFGKETFMQMTIKALASFASIVALSIFISSFFLNRVDYFGILGNLYLFLSVSLFFIGSIYAIKYFGMTTRIYYGFLTGYLTIFFFRPITLAPLSKNFFPIIFVLLGFSLIYFIIKPYNWIWQYL